jgi:hypothetical protein
VPRRVQQPPEFLIDRRSSACRRNLGAKLVVHTLRSIYGEVRAQTIPDEEWIPEAAALGRLLLTKDDRIRRYPPAREAARASGAKIFCLPNAHMTTLQMRERFLNNLNRIVQRGRRDGPFMCAVDRDGLRLLRPRPSE